MNDLLTRINQSVLRSMHNEGIELRPDELCTHPDSILRLARAWLADRGFNVPDSDVEVKRLFCRELKKE